MHTASEGSRDGGIGGADQCEVVFVRYGEHDAPVPMLKNIGPVVLEQFAHDNVATAYQTNAAGTVEVYPAGEDLIDPGAAGIDLHLGIDGLGAAISQICGLDGPAKGVSFGILKPGARANVGAALCRISGVQHDKA